ncbi:MAG TPA: PQQ-binding-like beta-propeller repeat protein [Blastocatellia bacterium]|nr:PQQ-binding-like beta-propeller repeat protein [Blastocatellia bacterium]
MDAILSNCLALALLLFSFTPAQHVRSASDWTDWRGPARNGISGEKGLPDRWSPKGENLVWKAPYGGRSAPIVMSGRVFLFNTSGEGETMQERVMCLNADTGKLLWEHRLNVYESDVPPRRIAWSSPAGDPTTGNLYVLGACNELTAFSNDGKVLWSRSLTEEFGAWTTHGGRTTSPIIEGDLVIVGTIIDGWGDTAQRKHRFYAFDKRTGECVWTSAPGGRPYDTVYPTPIAATINGTRMIIVGGADGAVQAMKAQTGEPVWSFPITKRGINNCAVISGNTVFASHSEENLDTNEMGLLAAIDATGKGALGKSSIKWSVSGIRGGYSSPIVDGDRIYLIDDSANLFAFDINTGKELWKHTLGTLQRASPVLADGKLYVGTENGKFFILKPGPTGCQVLSETELGTVEKVELKTEAGDEAVSANEQILAAVAVSRGRVYLVTTKGVYCIGKKTPSPALPVAGEQVETNSAPITESQPAHVQVVPADLIVKPGETAKFKVRLFDDRGRFLREEQNATWSLEGLKGSAESNQFTAAADAGVQAGMVKATVGAIAGVSRVRVIPQMPISENFDSIPVDGVPKYWISTGGKYNVREVDGNRVLVKNPNPPAFKRARSLFSPVDWSNYSTQADVRATEKRRQMGDAGVVAQRYELAIMGNSQKIELRSWQIEEKRTVRKPFAWKADTWYRLKLQVENLPDGRVRARGKAWPASDAEPAEWMLERIDALGNHKGAAGVFADAPSEVFIDNVKVTPNN